MIDDFTPPGYAPNSVRRHARALAAGSGMPPSSEILTIVGESRQFLELLRAAGATWEVVGRGVEWGVGSRPSTWRSVVEEEGELPGSRRIEMIAGAIRFHLAGRSFVAVAHTESHRANPVGMLTIAGESIEALEVVARLLSPEPNGRTAVFHGGVRGQELRIVEPVPRDQLVLPPSCPESLLEDLDGFWQHANAARACGVRARRGLILAGLPGTGKTQFVRHLLARYGDIDAHVIAEGQGLRVCFELMVTQIGQVGRPGIVVLEDLERLLETRAIPAQLLLNVLDGLLDPGMPVLWVATTNDPSALDRALLDRPGRFDHVITFDLPDQPRRERMFELWSPPGQPRKGLEGWARLANGLAGAHIRAACERARFATWGSSAGYPAALPGYIAQMKDLHDRAPKIGSTGADLRVGFIPGTLTP